MLTRLPTGQSAKAVLRMGTEDRNVVRLLQLLQCTTDCDHASPGLGSSGAEELIMLHVDSMREG